MSQPFRDLPVFSRDPWQMSYGERAALEGILSSLRPRLSIEIGRAEGGSLRRIAAHSEAVISLDLIEAPAEIGELANVTLRVGDSRRLLPEELSRLATAGENVDFVLVDGDHSAAGARTDVLALLESPAARHTLILAHDSLNEDVRTGLMSVPFAEYEKVAWVDLDFLPGGVAKQGSLRGHCWGGLALIVVDETGAFDAGGLFNETYFPMSDALWSWGRAQRDPPATTGDPPATTGDPPATTGEQLRRRRWRKRG
ncbi:MAG TPA: class I SAM-dependent methyltransferase [Solirubrobacteraceae bacterium]|nr:class I SAM-dependent methyltransferase [Solirubrobacteraceae bacterium]